MSEISLKTMATIGPNAICPRDQIDGLFSVYLLNGCAWRHSKTHSLLLLLILCRAAFHSIHTTHWFEPRQWPYRMAWDWLNTVFLAKRSCLYRHSKHSDSVTDRQAYFGLHFAYNTGSATVTVSVTDTSIFVPGWNRIPHYARLRSLYGSAHRVIVSTTYLIAGRGLIFQYFSNRWWCS